MFLCYRTYNKRSCYLCIEIIKDILSTVFPNGEDKKRGNMKTTNEMNQKAIVLLQYQLRRYKLMGNGVACQFLNGKLQKLMAEQAKA